MTDKPKPPEHLSAAAAQWWTDIVAEYEFSDPDARLLLQTAEEREHLRELWREHGRRLMDEAAADGSPEPWGLLEFGEPGDTDNASGH